RCLLSFFQQCRDAIGTFERDERISHAAKYHDRVDSFECRISHGYVTEWLSLEIIVTLNEFQMTDKIVVVSTCGSEEEAARIAKKLVDSHIAACVNLLPRIRSFYRWR